MRSLHHYSCTSIWDTEALLRCGGSIDGKQINPAELRPQHEWPCMRDRTDWLTDRKHRHRHINLHPYTEELMSVNELTLDVDSPAAVSPWLPENTVVRQWMNKSVLFSTQRIIWTSRDALLFQHNRMYLTNVPPPFGFLFDLYFCLNC